MNSVLKFEESELKTQYFKTFLLQEVEEFQNQAGIGRIGTSQGMTPPFSSLGLSSYVSLL